MPAAGEWDFMTSGERQTDIAKDGKRALGWQTSVWTEEQFYAAYRHFPEIKKTGSSL